MGNLGFYYNQVDCIGCRVCQVACKDANNLDEGVLYRKVNAFEVGDYGSVQAYFYSAACNHCENPACVAYCPTGAMHKSEEEGVVVHDDDVCIGCQQCMNSCPYSVPQYLPDKNITGKCTSCISIRNQYGNPPCVDACPMHVLKFGDIDELKAEHPEAVSDIAILPSSSETNPSLLIDAKAGSEKSGSSITML